MVVVAELEAEKLWVEVAVDVWVLNAHVRNGPDWNASIASFRAETASQLLLKSFSSPVGLQTIEFGSTSPLENSETAAERMDATSRHDVATVTTITPDPATSGQLNKASTPPHVCTSTERVAARGLHF